MESYRKVLRSEIRNRYGHYCNLAKGSAVAPIPYVHFADLYARGFNVKEIFNERKR
jgi:hypothetical protein